MNVKPLAIAILLQATRDWDSYIQGKPVREAGLRYSLQEIKDFLESDWGRYLCEVCDLKSDVVQEKLDKRLNDFLNERW